MGRGKEHNNYVKNKKKQNTDYFFLLKQIQILPRTQSHKTSYINALKSCKINYSKTLCVKKKKT